MNVTVSGIGFGLGPDARAKEHVTPRVPERTGQTPIFGKVLEALTASPSLARQASIQSFLEPKIISAERAWRSASESGYWIRLATMARPTDRPSLVTKKFSAARS
jgi:hypothetical protein